MLHFNFTWSKFSRLTRPTVVAFRIPDALVIPFGAGKFKSATQLRLTHQSPGLLFGLI
jgi:hypothetical protein